MELLIKTFAGLEDVLAGELQALGAQDITTHTRALSCQGDQRLLYAANLHLRTALRVLVPIANFRVRDEQDLYRRINRIDWRPYLANDRTLAIDTVTQSERLNHSHFLSLKTKDAIVDQLRQATGRRPNVDLERPDVRIHLHIDRDNQCTLHLDSSGDGLHRRGYRTGGGEAPLNEVLAAGLIQLTGWERDGAFVDPFCGSGTLLIEAATFAYNIPPGWNRRFGFQRWPDFNAKLWENVREEAQHGFREFNYPIVGSDRDFKMVKLAHSNVYAAGLEGKIQIEKQDFARMSPPPPPGIVVTNPPYDIRVQNNDIEALYSAFGDKLKQDFTGYTAWVFTGNLDALKRLGLRSARRIDLLNAQIACKFARFDLYAGSRRADSDVSTEA